MSLSGSTLPLVSALEIAFQSKQKLFLFFFFFPLPISHIIFHTAIQFISLFSMSLFVCLLCHCIVFCLSVESIHATLDLNSDMQCPWAPGIDGYMNSI